LTGRSARALQRLFDEYVGPGPKWVIDRYRMIGALDSLNAGVKTSLTDLAYELGYLDQAHFIKTFQSLTGYSPSEYQRT
jgi:AraC-like DNA-binding protein